VTVAVLGLGGNIGDTRTFMTLALEGLKQTAGTEVEAVSALYRTPPWGKTDQADFLNAAVRINTVLTSRALLETVLLVERQLGRQRDQTWGPRTIDIDILIFGARQIDEPGLHVPHPRLTERAFALAPLVDVMPGVKLHGRSAADWLAAADAEGMVRLAGPDWYRVGNA